MWDRTTEDEIRFMGIVPQPPPTDRPIARQIEREPEVVAAPVPEVAPITQSSWVSRMFMSGPNNMFDVIILFIVILMAGEVLKEIAHDLFRSRRCKRCGASN